MDNFHNPKLSRDYDMVDISYTQYKTINTVMRIIEYFEKTPRTPEKKCSGLQVDHSLRQISRSFLFCKN